MEYGLIANTLKHSFSKEIHALFADYEYILKELDEDSIRSFMMERDFKAINVTIPYKQTVIPYLDSISETAKGIGAVNTVVNKNGKLFGFNTDFFGMKALLLHAGIDIKAKKVAVLGTGGTSKTANYVAKILGAKEVLTVSRNPKIGQIGYDELYESHTDTDVIINTTPVGMFPKIDACAVDIDRFKNLSGVADAIYNPLRTELVLNAEKRGIPAAGGLYMLVAQAAEAVEKFIGKKIPKKQIDAVYNSVKCRKQNIVLYGMPASGKSTLGSQLAKELGKSFFDTDELIEKRENKTITQIFSESGEQGFRKTEAEVIAEVAVSTGAVIATGGGAVLNSRNVFELSKNGIAIFIDRPLEKLHGTPDRPLAKNAEQLVALYNERKKLYLNAADICFLPTDDINDNVKRLKVIAKSGVKK